MESALLEFQKDLEEVKQLLEKATRKRVRDVLFVEQRKLETEIANKRQQQTGESMEVQKPSAIVPPISTTYTVKISNYGWDQSDKFVKIYITLKDVQNIPADNVQVQFTERSFELLVKDLNGKNHVMTVNNLLKQITPENSSRKVKTDTVLIMLRKKSESKWEYLTQVEKQTKEKKDKLPMDTDEDPSAGLMNVLKKIYDDGDDEMKRTLNKAWVESRDKQMKGDMDF
ncbi:PREDICTED: calcyclin-binding protein [Nanorana parkeri]|uniref:calcyclin-binding protein n=1 Tax=Nanorana parkeri TaxID=125878 RepID=UPI000854B221|nr:PREDICTED: calcyclin-binding protein [Nanorana parkeri]